MIPTVADVHQRRVNPDDSDDEPGSSDDEAEGKVRRQRLASTTSRLHPKAA
jgi:hypothetical protein